jgi:hypothetical protein
LIVECDECRAKPGSPTLCKGCLANRATVAETATEIRKAVDAIWHVSQAIAERSPGRRDMEIRLANSCLLHALEKLGG